MKLTTLTPEEKKVLLDKHTERPFTGEYTDFFEVGIYSCRQCGAALYRSQDKFVSDCGWPSFDAAVLGAVLQKPDADERRVEILCRRCGGHLGHVFTGEGYTQKNTRHCVNSISMRFTPETSSKEYLETTYLGGGCFWCIEAVFKSVIGVQRVVSGYTGGTQESPTYEEVSRGTTGYAEVVEVRYDSRVLSYEGLLDVFFAAHNPTTPNQQGADRGTQYRSLIAYTSADQGEIAKRMIEEVTQTGVYEDPVVTKVIPFTTFYSAEEYHQSFYDKNPSNGYCKLVIEPKRRKLLENLREYFH